MLKLIVMTAALTVGVASFAAAADLPRRQPAPVAAAPVGKAPIGKFPIGKYPQAAAPVYTKG